MNKILELARPDILALQPYQHAAWEPSLERLHANEMPWRASGDPTLAGLNRYPEPQPAQTSKGPVAPLVVFAAASLTEAFTTIADDFQRRAGQTVTLSFGSSATLATQITAGAPADVFAAATPATMKTASCQR